MSVEQNEPEDESTWAEVQARCADAPGLAGIELRRIQYRPFFLKLAPNVVIEQGCRFSHPENIVLEDDARLNIQCLIYGSGGVRIGRHARVGPRCFIHSANHDVSSEHPLAFFERGYVDQRVDIGDNVLISANVSIMPGSRIGAGSLIAAGAVVPRGDYADSERLVGVPAVSRIGRAPRKFESAPEIALMGAQQDLWQGMRRLLGGAPPREDFSALAAHVLDTLGLPQVALLQPTDPIPSTVHTLVLLPGARSPRHAASALDIWRFVEGDSYQREAIELRTAHEGRLTLPAQRRAVFRPLATMQSDMPVRQKALALWLKDRLEKRNEPLPPGEFAEWLALLRLVEIAPQRQDGLGERIVAALNRRWPPSLLHLQTPDLNDGFFRALLADGALTGAEENQRRQRRALQHPGFLVLEALEKHEAGEADNLLGFIARVEPVCQNTLRLLALGLSARASGLGDVEARVAAALNEPGLWPARGIVPYATNNGRSLAMTPLLLAWWLTEAPSSAVPEGLFAEIEHITPMPWTALPCDGPLQLDEERALLDPVNRSISASLLTAWCALHSAESREGFSRKLEDAAYDGGVEALQRVWTSVFRHLQHTKQRDLIVLRPWPARAMAALSLRYDVDRPISAARMRQLVELQAQEAGGPIGSWYFRQFDEGAERLKPLLDRTWQESGQHVEVDSEAIAGAAITYHSAPTAEYWRGDSSNAALAQRGAAFGEFHASELPTPRSALSGGLTLAALHFPLEGGTQDQGLAYFDRLSEAFERRLAGGGHIILASHPDVDEAPLIELLRRLSASPLWKAPIGAVCRRYAQIMRRGAIVSLMEAGRAALVSQETLADVQVEIWRADGGIERRTLQLQAGAPRRIEG